MTEQQPKKAPRHRITMLKNYCSEPDEIDHQFLDDLGRAPKGTMVEVSVAVKKKLISAKLATAE